MFDKNNLRQGKPLVSIIMPVYNAGCFLVEALNSVFNQTYTNIEVIAVNDGSTDRSLEILKEHQKFEPRLKIISYMKNLGVGEAANIGIRRAKGDYIARVDSDDIVPIDRIEKQVKFLINHTQVVVVGGQVELVTEDGTLIVNKKFPLKHKDIVNMAFVTMPIQQGAMMVNKKLLLEQFVWYNTDLKTSEDLDFFFRIFRYGKAANLPDTVLYYRQHGRSITQAECPREIFYQAYAIRMVALRTYGIKPDIHALVISWMQYILISILPSKLVYPLYYIWRGLKPLQLSTYIPLFQYLKTYLF